MSTTEKIETKELETTAPKPLYTFRKLNSTDTFLMFRIIGKIGIDEFAAVFDKQQLKSLIDKTAEEKDGVQDETQVGIAVVLKIADKLIGNLPRCEEEIYQMLANVSNLSVEEVKGLDFAVFAKMVIDFVRKEEFKDFIEVVSKLFKQEN